MLYYTLKRIALAILVAITVSIVAFMLLRLSGDPATAIAGPDATQEEVEFVRAQYKLDRPLPEQYMDWAGRALKGDFGISPYFNAPVRGIIGNRLQVTVILGACALGFAVIVGIPMGTLAAIRPNTWLDRIALVFSVGGQAMPSFFFALVLIIVFGVILRWTPISGSTSWQHFILPTICLGYYATPSIMRLTRSGMIEVLSSDYIRTARAKGLRAGSVFFKHALRNAIIPVVSVMAVQFGFMLGGSLVVESVFAINGLGYLGWQSLERADLPMVQAILVMISMFYIGLTFFSDLLNAFLDPRIRVK